ncbi:transposase IS66, partial [Neobacillus vireti LMG 21834]
GRNAQAPGIFVETAIANGLDPYYYLRHLFEQLPNMNLTDMNALDQVLPWSTTLPVSCISLKKLPK